uniref:Uncharacterized protein n=1 Tax=Plectus sambesii TaxID=2011161 RepID=A0A914VEU1_9BILA
NSQGDRLLHIKAVKQHQLPRVSQPLSVHPTTGVLFTSPTTPVKPLAPPRSKPSASALHNAHIHGHRQLGFGEALPATKRRTVSTDAD